MPLVAYSLQIIRDTFAEIRKDPHRTNRVLTLSYPDVIAAVGDVTEIFGDRLRGVRCRDDGELSINWHKAHAITTEVLDTKDLFKALGFEMDAVDQVEGRGGEIIRDLNEPLPPETEQQYDLVFDCISNQVFNIATCWASMIAACRVGGYVLSVTPVQMVNQGFWNVSPAAYYDFCAANCMTLVHTGVVGVYEERATAVMEPCIRMRGVADDTMNVALMQKTAHLPTVWPNMTKFKKYPKCQIPTLTKSPL